MKHPFVQALIEMGIYDEYFKELKNYRGHYLQTFFRLECNHLTSGSTMARGTLQRSFSFSSSTQGTTFWYAMCDKINAVYYRIKLETA